MSANKNKVIGEVKLPGIGEKTVIEMVQSLPALAPIDREFTLLANQRSITFREFANHVEGVIGAHLIEPVRDQLNWDYIASAWMDENEPTPQWPEDDINYNRTIPVGSFGDITSRLAQSFDPFRHLN